MKHIIAPIGFFVFAIASLILSITVVPEPQASHVLCMGAASGGFGLLSTQI
jgi:succinate-acetate transporter protein